MAYRFRNRVVEEGDITDPLDWLLNMSELIGEANGRVDRDNIEEQAIAASSIKINAFNQLFEDSYAAGAEDFVLAAETMGWQATDASGYVLGRKEIDLKTDSLVRAYWSGTWAWGYDKTGAGAPGMTAVNECCARFALLIDGNEVSRIQRVSAAHLYYSASMGGTIPLEAGAHVVEVKGRIWNEVVNTVSTWDCTVYARELLVHIRRR